IDESFGREAEIIEVVAALALAGLADLPDEFSVLRELEDHVVVEALETARTTASGRERFVAPADSTASAGTAAAIAADPDVALVADGDAVIRMGPIVPLAFAAPMSDQVSGFIEFEDRRSRGAALSGGRFGLGVQFAWFERPATMDDPDVIAGVDRDA